jgi:hypothetical protein
MDEPTHQDAQHKKWETLFKWGLGFAGAVIVAPYVYYAIQGLVGLAIAAAIGLTVIQLAPWFSMKLANWRMKLIVSEATANPIETMRNLYLEKTQELATADENIVDFETEIHNFDDQVGEFKRQYPNEAQTYETLSAKMGEALADMKGQQTEARKALSDFQTKIKKAEAIYKMSLAAQKVTQLSKSAEAQVFAQIKEQVAFDSVRTQLNKSFASLNLSLEKRSDARAALPVQKSGEALVIPLKTKGTR